MKNKKQNSVINSYNNIDSPQNKYLKPIIEENSDTDEIFKKLENLNFSSEGKSFETPFKSISKKKTKKGINKDKNISIPNLISDNIVDDIPSELKTVKEEDSSYSDFIDKFILSKHKNQKQDKNYEKSNDIYQILLKEKINRILISLQNYNINQKTYNKMNSSISYVNDLNNILYKPFDSVLDVILDLLSKIKEEYIIKEGLVNKLSDISLNKETYEKKMFEIKKELIYKEKELETLMNDNSQKKTKNNSNQKSTSSEINNIKKENQFLFEKVLSYKNQLKELYAEYKILYEKYKICLKEIDNQKDKSKNIKTFMKENTNDFMIVMKSNKSTPHKRIKSTTNYNCLNKSNDKLSVSANSPNFINIKKLASDLISFLLDINQMIFKYDFTLMKINKNKNLKSSLNDINTLSSNIDINFLKNEQNYKLFSKYFKCNLDIIYNKLINLHNKNNITNRSPNEKKKGNSRITSLNNSRTNQSINLFVPDKKNCAKSFKTYISIKRNMIKKKNYNKNIFRNSTSRNGFSSYLNIYSDMDIDGNSNTKKEMSNKIDKKYNSTFNLDKTNKSQNNQNGAKLV
jgi:hypothetical protein